MTTRSALANLASFAEPIRIEPMVQEVSVRVRLLIPDPDEVLECMADELGPEIYEALLEEHGGRAPWLTPTYSEDDVVAAVKLYLSGFSVESFEAAIAGFLWGAACTDDVEEPSADDWQRLVVAVAESNEMGALRLLEQLCREILLLVVSDAPVGTVCIVDEQGGFALVTLDTLEQRPVVAWEPCFRTDSDVPEVGVADVWSGHKHRHTVH
jgi:hypothetical protein